MSMFGGRAASGWTQVNPSSARSSQSTKIYRSPEPGCSSRSRLSRHSGNTVCSAPDPCPQQSASSDPSANGKGIISYPAAFPRHPAIAARLFSQTKIENSNSASLAGCGMFYCRRWLPFVTVRNNHCPISAASRRAFRTGNPDTRRAVHQEISSVPC